MGWEALLTIMGMGHIGTRSGTRTGTPMPVTVTRMGLWIPR